jgi:hypothetical protein
MSLEKYIGTLGPSTAGKSMSTLKLEAQTKTGIRAEEIQ